MWMVRRARARATPRGPADVLPACGHPQTWLGAADSGTPGGHCWVAWTSQAGARRRLGGGEASGHLDCLRPAPWPLCKPPRLRLGGPCGTGFSPRLCLSYWRLSQSPSLGHLFLPCVSVCVLSAFSVSPLCLFSAFPALSRLFSCAPPIFPPCVFVSGPQPPPRHLIVSLSLPSLADLPNPTCC